MAVLHLNRSNFDETVKNGVVLVDFWADWCGPCRLLAPTIERLADRYAGRAAVCKVNIDEEADLAARFGILSIPTVLVFRDGELVRNAVGVQPEDAIARLLDDALSA